MEHTKTPWDCDYEYTSAHIAGGEIIDMEPTGMYEVFANGGEDIICIANKANALRIVACVNACEGIETEILEALPLNFKQHAIEFEILKAQNARLLEALKELVNATSDDFAAAYGFEVERNNAFKIISEAEKTTAP